MTEVKQFRKKPVVIEAKQWFKDGDSDQVQPRKAEIIFDRAGNYFYISHCDSEIKYPQAWLAVEQDGECARQNGEVLPFSFYELKSGLRVPIADKPELAQKYSDKYFGGKTPRDFGYIKTLDGGHIVAPGDWIIKSPNGEFYPCKPDTFADNYEEAT